MKILHLLILALLGVMIGRKHGAPVYLAANEAGTEGTHTGPVSYTAQTALERGRMVQFATPAHPSSRQVKYADGTGKVIGVTLGSSDAGQPVAVHVLGATAGTVAIETDGPVARLDKISPAADGKGTKAGEAGALSADVVAVALETNDYNDVVECVGNAAAMFS